jgi:chemotaxis protein MotB
MTLGKERKKDADKLPDNTMMLYTSLVLIILTFFIMITTKANFDETKYGKVVRSVTGAFGFLEGGVSPTGAEDGLPLEGASLSEGMPVLPVQDLEMNQIRSILSPSVLDGEARIIRSKAQRIISLSSGMVFLPDSAEPTPEAKEILLSFARVMRDSPVPITVEGHTDNLPPSREGVGDNWNLSLNRALAVLSILNEEGGIDLKRLSAYGYAGQKPIVANNSEANRAKNNRVDLVLDYDATREGSLRGLSPRDRNFDFQGFQFDLPDRPQEGEGEVY